MFADGSTSNNWGLGSRGNLEYCGPDHASKSGAQKLALRLQKFWEERGERREFEVYNTGVQDGTLVFGVRARRPLINPSCRVEKLINDVLDKYHPPLRYADLLEVDRKNIKAIHDCICAVRATWPNMPLSEIAIRFNVHRWTVSRALQAAHYGPKQ